VVKILLADTTLFFWGGSCGVTLTIFLYHTEFHDYLCVKFLGKLTVVGVTLSPHVCVCGGGIFV
jgi:hypothetical protein